MTASSPRLGCPGLPPAANFLVAPGLVSIIRAVTEPDGSKGASAARIVLNGALFLGVLVLGCLLLGRAAPFPEVPGVFPKWRYFREDLAKYDTLFVGSSRFYHQIIPRQFDAAVAKAGGSTKSFNFAYDGMWPPESFYFLRRILALRPPRLKWVVFDLMDINSQLDDRNNSTLRMAYWHDIAHTRIAVREIAESRRKPWQKRDLIGRHLRLCAQQVFNLGRGSELVQTRLAPPPKKKRKYSWDQHDGWEVGPDRAMEGAKLQEYLDAVAQMKLGLAPNPVRPVFRDALAGLIADVRRAGAEPIFVITPTINPMENYTEVPGGVPVWAFNDPNQFPQLFAPDRHYDAWHLNEKGAVEFTALLAERFSKMPRR